MRNAQVACRIILGLLSTVKKIITTITIVISRYRPFDDRISHLRLLMLGFVESCMIVRGITSELENVLSNVLC